MAIHSSAVCPGSWRSVVASTTATAASTNAFARIAPGFLQLKVETTHRGSLVLLFFSCQLCTLHTPHPFLLVIRLTTYVQKKFEMSQGSSYEAGLCLVFATLELAGFSG